MASYWKIACVLFVLIIQAHSQHSDKVPFTFVDGAVQNGAVCIDGSPAGYYHATGFGEGANGWLVYLQGGAWCTSNSSCQERRGSNLGSTKNVTAMYFGGILSSNQTINPDLYNWNKVFVYYCDGSSFIGDTEGPNLQLRGSRIFSAVMDELLTKGMKRANNAILAGGSAGGLATILQCDNFRAILPNECRVKCIPDSGFFIHAKNLPYAYFREAVFADTIKFHCLFPEYLVGNIQTPLFLLNSAFDKYQIQVNLKPDPPNLPGWGFCGYNAIDCTLAQRQLIKDFRNAFLQALKEIGDNPSRGMFINSCYSHDYLEFSGMWNSKGSPRLENKTISQVVGDWYFDRNSVQLIDTQNDFAVDCTVS